MAANAGGFADQGLVLFGHTTEDGGTYAVWEVFVFMVIAVIGGLVGSLYVYINEHITIARKKFWAGKSPLWRVVESWVVIGGMLTLFFWLPMLWPCKDVPSNDDMSHHTGFHGINPVQYNCVDDHQRRLASGSDTPTVYNEFATLLLTPQETTILQLYSRNTQGYFSITTLAIFTVFFFVCAVTAYGVAVPAGLFIPSMMIGAGFGRLIGGEEERRGGEAAMQKKELRLALPKPITNTKPQTPPTAEIVYLIAPGKVDPCSSREQVDWAR
jgi:chloride channel 7